MKSIVACLLACTLGFALAADSGQFRGPDRNGIFPETGLMKSWPEGGPEEIWAVTGLGKGFGSVAVADGHIYVTGQHEQSGFLYAYDLDGNLKYKKELGELHSGSGFPGTRSTPTVDGDTLYVMQSMGKLYSFDAKSGKQNWMVNLPERFPGSKTPYFGFSESVLIDGDNLICTPGGTDATVVALNKKTGETVWQSKGISENASYCSVRVFEHGGKRQLITMTGKSMIGLDPQTGGLLWRYDYPAEYDIHAVSPVFNGNNIYVSDGYGQGGTMVSLNDDGKGVTMRWKEETMDVHHGGLVHLDGYIYGASDRGDWTVLDFETGEVVNKIKGVGKGSIIYADGMIYGYGEKGGVGLFKAGPDDFEMVSTFKITKGRGQHWAHPVISGGRLYIRHGDVLMAFKIK
jgi:outer membrane protein assembly factor BamB